MALYNTNKHRIKQSIDCIDCFFKDKETKQCKGMGTCCFEIDVKTGVLIDHKTGLPIKKEVIEKWKQQ